MGMDHCHHIRARAIDLAMDETFGKELPALRISHIAIEIVHENIAARYELGRDGTRHQKAGRVVRMAYADMAPDIDDTLVDQHAICGNEILYERRTHRPGPGNRLGFR